MSKENKMAVVGARGTVLYAAVGPVLRRYAVDPEAAELAGAEAVTLPANVQYAWPHISRRYLYVASSDAVPGQPSAGGRHSVTAFSVDAVSGKLTEHGQTLSLPARPIHITTDSESRHVLVAFNNPAAIRVFRINDDGTLGSEIKQHNHIDAGIFAHQVRVTSDGQNAILVTRGNDAGPGRPEDPGALKVFDYSMGQLSNEVSIAPNEGYGFGPRHLDFHPSRPWIYVSLERQNALATFKIDHGAVSSGPLFLKNALSAPVSPGSEQMGGAVHVHPAGHVVYVANRSSGAVQHNDAKVLAGGENTLAVYGIDPSTGEPRIIQHIDTGGIHCRNFQIDPSGRLLVASHVTGLHVREGAEVRYVPARLTLFRIAADGRLEFVRAYDIDAGKDQMFWMGMLGL